MDLDTKLTILADAAKYDASDASSGGRARDSVDGQGLGSNDGMGICHSYTPDGRCISLLKILLANFCRYDCLYCVNRVTSNVPRARFTAQEVVRLTLDCYRHNWIAGLFLSSGIIRSPDYTRSMARLRVHIDEAWGEAKDATRLSVISMPGARPRRTAAPQFAAAGQSTQMVVGANAADDATILAASANLYGAYRLKRVCYSAFSPIPDASSSLPLKAPPLLREHRLYQADWLMRFYGFAAGEITAAESGGMLSFEVDPKLAWALSHEERFPVDLNRAPRELLLRAPGPQALACRMKAAPRQGALF